MPFGYIQMAAAEKYRKHHQDQGDEKGGVVGNVSSTNGVLLADHEVEAFWNGFQLNRNIGNDADNRHDGHNRPQSGALAVSWSNKIGNWGNVLGLADTDDFSEHQPTQGNHQGRADIDGQETGPRSNRAPHTAVECPGCTVHSHGKGLDIGVAGDAAADPGHPVAVVGNGKQQPDVGKRNGDKGSGRNHYLIRPACFKGMAANAVHSVPCACRSRPSLRKALLKGSLRVIVFSPGIYCGLLW